MPIIAASFNLIVLCDTVSSVTVGLAQFAKFEVFTMVIQVEVFWAVTLV
jgi:hypothetical protein